MFKSTRRSLQSSASTRDEQGDLAHWSGAGPVLPEAPHPRDELEYMLRLQGAKSASTVLLHTMRVWRRKSVTDRDDTYFEILASSLRVCAEYKPKFGTGGKSGLTKAQFQARYGADPFYRWVGLDSPLIYAAHKAAGGMTSIYRQLGIGGERLFRQVVRDQLRLDADQAMWAYTIPGQGGKDRTLALDARISFDDIDDRDARKRVERWAGGVAQELELEADFVADMKGVVFEVRQGYKSADSKRQNADVANASNAYANLYVPSLVLLSTQINEAVSLRYVAARWLLLTGSVGGSPMDSTYAFCRDILAYDLAAFFERNTDRFRTLIEEIASSLLTPDDD